MEKNHSRQKKKMQRFKLQPMTPRKSEAQNQLSNSRIGILRTSHYPKGIGQPKMSVVNYLLACTPLIFPALLLIDLLDNPIPVVTRWFQWLLSHSKNPRDSSADEVPPVSSQLLAYLAMGIFGYVSTNRLVPVIKVSEVGRD